MEFDKFTEKVTGSIKDYLPQEYAEAKIEVSTIQKPHETYTGLILWKNSDMAATAVNLDQFYRMYETGQMDLEAVTEQIANTAQRGVELTDWGIFTQYEKAKDRLSIRLCSKDRMADLLEHVPHTVYGDMAMVYHVTIQKEGNAVSSSVISDSLLNTYGVSKEQLHQDALANSRKEMPPKIQSVGKALENMYREALAELEMPEEMIEEFLADFAEPPEYPMYALSNEWGVDGAGTLFYPDMMDELGELLEGSYFILPSSIHEVFVCPDDGSVDYHELEEVVSSTNADKVPEKEVLSDTVYHYDATERVFERVEDFKQRMEQREQGPGQKEKKDREEAEHKAAVKKSKNEMSL